MKRRGRFITKEFLILSLITFLLIPTVNSDTLPNFTKEPLTSEKFNYLRLIESESKTQCPDGNCYIVWELCNLSKLNQNNKALSYFVTDLNQKEDKSNEVLNNKYQIFDKEIIHNESYTYDCIEINNITGATNCKISYSTYKENIYKDSNTIEILNEAFAKCIKVKQIVNLPISSDKLRDQGIEIDVIPKLYNYVYPEWVTLSSSNLLAGYHFTAGNLADTKGLHNAVQWQAISPIQSADFNNQTNKALFFKDATSDAISIINIDDDILQFSTNESFTISVWTNSSKDNAYYVLGSSGTGGYSYNNIWMYFGGGNIRTVMEAQESDSIDCSKPFNLNERYHIVYTNDASVGNGNATIYVNGEKCLSRTWTNANSIINKATSTAGIGTNGTWTLGNWYNDDDSSGVIDELSFWSAASTGEDANWLYTHYDDWDSFNLAPTLISNYINTSSTNLNNYTVDNLLQYVQASDNESNSLYAYQQIYNGSEIYSLIQSNITNNTLIQLTILNNNITKKWENWTFSFLVSDGYNNVSWNNASIMILNSPLSLTSISSTVSNNLTTDYQTEKFNITSFDYDFNDGYLVNCKFYINDTENTTIISSSILGNNGYCGLAIQNLTQGNYNISLQVIEGIEIVKMDWLLTVTTKYEAILTSSLGLNSTSENLTCTVPNLPASITKLFSWYKNGNSLNSLYLPFEIDANDYSGNNNNGTVYNASLITGKYGKYAYSFDGNDYINISDSNSLDDIKTFELWFKRDFNNPEVLFDKSNIENQTNYKLAFDSNNKLVFSYNSIDGAGNYTWLTSTQSDFDQGSYSNVNYSTNHIELSSGQSTGLYTSKIFDANSSSIWNKITFGTDLPYQQELPNNKGSDSGADMSGNVLLMHMNENSGSIIDSSGENNNGNYNGSLYAQEGKFNKALGFDGSSNYLQIPSSSGDELDIKSDITVSAWIKWKGPSDPPDIYYPRIIEKSYTTSYMFSLKPDDATSLSVWLNNGERASTSAGSLSLNQWHYVAFTFNDITNNVIIYIDGEQSSTGSYTGIIPGSNNDVYIGRYPLDTVAYWNGSIDEVAVYNRSLTANEILNNYKRGALRLNLTARTCDDISCIGEDFTDVNDISPQNLSLNNNRYFQYKFDFSTENISYSPELYNVSIDYSVSGINISEVNIISNSTIDDNAWHHTAITFDESNLKLYLDGILDNFKAETNLPEHKNNGLFIGRDYSGTNYFTGDLDEIRFYDNVLSPEQINAHSNLEYNQIMSQELNTNDLWRCDVTPNDGSKDFDRISSNNLIVLGAIYDITFNLIDSFTGEQVITQNDLDINCSNGLNVNNVNNPYGPIIFYEGEYSCTFVAYERFDKTISFTADSDKIVNVPMSIKAQLTPEEHFWLESTYNCLYGNVSCNLNS